MSQPPFGSWPPPVPGGTTSSDFVTNNSTVPGVTVTAALNALFAVGPARTFFVSTAWPAGDRPATHFTDPQAAIDAAAAIGPTHDNPAVVIVYPGVYAQNLTLVSSVHMFGFTSNGTRFTGTVTWKPSQGANVPQAALRERIYVRGLRFDGAWTYDVTGKPLGQFAELALVATDIRADLTALGRALAGGQDFIDIYQSVQGGAAWLLDGMVPNIYQGTQLGAGPAGITLKDNVFGATLAGLFTFSGLHLINSPGVLGNGNAFADVDVDATSSLGTVGSNLGTLTVAAGGTADVRHSTYTALAGLGAINRDTTLMSVGPTAVGANAVAIAPPLMDANYNVLLTLTAGAAAPGLITVTGKTASGFTINDPAGGHTFDVTIQHV